MTRLLLALLCAFAGLPSAMVGAGLQDPTHEHCCCCEDHVQADGPLLAKTPCGCGCLEPVRSPEFPPEPPRERSSQDAPAPVALPAAPRLPLPATRLAPRALQPSPVPLRAPPPRAALGVWIE